MELGVQMQNTNVEEAADMYSSSTPNLLKNMSNSIMQKRLSEYLLDYDDKYGVLLRICGGFHIPSSWSDHKYITLWRTFLYICFTFFSVFTIIPGLVFLAIEENLIILWYIGVFLQCLLIIPVLHMTYKRLNQFMTVEYAVAVGPTLRICRIYFIIGMILWVVLYISDCFDNFVFNPKNTTNDILIDLFWVTVQSLGFLSLTLFDMWAVFFVVLDAQVSLVQVKCLISEAKSQTLTLDTYREAYENLIVVNSTSALILDAIAILAYVSIAMFGMMLLFVNIHIDLAIICFGLGTMLRESLLLFIALPYIATVNELHDELRYVLADREWRGTGDTPLLDKEEKNNRCLRLWALSIERPLYMKILGRHIKVKEMKAQSLAVVFVFMGSVLSFFANQIYSAEA